MNHNRRNFLKLSSLGLAGSALPGLATPKAHSAGPVDTFSQCVLADQAGSPRSLLESCLRCWPELQIQPRPVSVPSLVARLRLFRQLEAELAMFDPAEIGQTVFPITGRYPAWLAAGVSLDLFSLVLENSTLPEFELRGWAYEHVLPHTAFLDEARRPLTRLLTRPDSAFSPEVEAAVAGALEALAGRLFLLRDETLMALAGLLRQMLAQGEASTLLRLFVTVEAGAVPPFQATLAERAPGSDDFMWRLQATPDMWAKLTRKEVRAIDKVVLGLFTAGLLRSG